jgi:hypothetical protein
MLVAIGAYHECVDTQDWTRSIELFRFACFQYSRALTRLRQKALIISTEDVLLSCVLFMFFENIRGNMTAALDHLHAANAILREEQQRRSRNSPADLTFLSTTLTSIMKQLNASAARLRPALEQPTFSLTLPVQFSSLETANAHYYEMAHSLSAPLDHALRTKNWENFELVASGMLHEWWSAVARLQRTQRLVPYLSSYMELGFQHLELQFLSTSIHLDLALTPIEMQYDLHQESFEKILQTSQKMIQTLSALDCTNEDLGNFLGFTPSYISALGYVATLCHDPTLRRRAIEHLRSHQRVEIQWDSLLVADICDHFINLEESLKTTHVIERIDSQDISRIVLLNISSYDFDQATGRLRLYVLTILNQSPEHLLI